MRINCVGLADLLCAYADGELGDANKQLVEDHLAICDNCTTILKVYREMSASIDDTCVDPPAALVTGVMNRIMNEEVPRVETETVQRKRNRFILTRYLPVAACLVAMLLVWQFWGNTFFFGLTDTGAQAPEAVSPESRMTTSDALDTAGESGAGQHPAPAAGGGDNTSLNEPQADSHTSMSDDDNEGAMVRTDEDIELFLEFLDDAYADITITGELPAFLAGFEPHPFGPWLDWEYVFEIPSTDVQRLLDELDNRESFSIMHLNKESKYAIVFYSP